MIPMDSPPNHPISWGKYRYPYLPIYTWRNLAARLLVTVILSTPQLKTQFYKYVWTLTDFPESLPGL